ncbi:DUF983 domain-containing protein [Novosphingobium sp.]|uniref:DUF983 domain-containing protein n=1 Tax=Novosphingobium sp. TaxID=1874826 RepID=UPI0035B40005
MESPFASMLPRPALPDTFKSAILRGIKGKCPRCGEAKLFARFLKPVACCPACGQDWTLHRADDFPPYVSIIITGHVMAPVIIELAGNTNWPMWLKLAVCVAIATVLMIGLLQPAKGGIIALQWWNGMHEFKPGGRDELARAAGGGTSA